MFEEITGASGNKPYAVLVIVGLVTLFMTFGATQLSMTSETEDYLPSDYTSVKVTKEVEGYIGGTATEMVLIEGENLLSSDSFGAIADFQYLLSKKPIFKDENYIVRVQSYRNYIVPLLLKVAKRENIPISGGENMPYGEMFRPSMVIDQRTIREAENMLVGSFIGRDLKTALVTVTVDSQLSYSKLMDGTKILHQYTENFVKDNPGLEAGNSGGLSMEMETSGMMNRDNKILIPAAIIVIALILYLAFRRLSDMGLPFLILSLGAVWMIGTMGLIGISFTMIYVALVPIILGIGIDYTIHMLNRYYEETGGGLSVGKSAIRSVRTVGVAVALTAITTIIGFGSFGVSEIPPLRNLGFIAGAGVFYIFILATTLLPALLVIRDRRGESSEEREKRAGGDKIGNALSKIEKGTERHRWPVLIGAGAIAVLCVISSFGLTTSMSYDEFLPKNVDSVTTMEKIEKNFGGHESIILLARGNVTAPESLQSMLYLEENVKSDPRNEGIVTGTMSLADLVFQTLRDKYPQMRRIPQDPNQISTTIEKLKETFPERVERLLLDDNKTLIYFYVQTDTSQETRVATEMIRGHVRDLASSQSDGSGLTLTFEGEPAVGGSQAIMSDIMGSILPSMRNSIILAILLVVIVLSMVFKSPIIGLIGALPTVLALFWEFGAIQSLGWSLDVMNMTVSALAIGIGVDFSIHMVHRFQDEWKENGKSPEESISTAIKSVGRAITAGAATTIGAFAVLFLSRMPPVAKFGELAALIIFFCLVGSLIVLPSALLAYAKWKEG